MWVCTSPEAHRESNVSRWEAVVLLLDISRKTTVAQVRETVVFRCFAGCLVQARNHCNNRCCGLRNNASDVRPTDAAGVKPPSQTLASVFFAGCLVQALTWCVRLLLAKIVKFSVLKILKHTTFLENNRRKFLPPFGGLLFNIPYQIQLSMEMSRLTRDGSAEPVSRDQILRRERGQGNIHFSCSADHEQDWQPYPVDQYSCYLCNYIRLR